MSTQRSYLLCLALLWFGGRGLAAVDWPQIKFVQVTSGAQAPVQVTHAGDGSGRLFVAEHTGRVRILRDDRLLPRPFLQMEHRVQRFYERGFLGIAFPPSFRQKQYFYVYYTRAPE